MRRLIGIGMACVLAGCGGGRVAPVRHGTIAMNTEVSSSLSRGDARLQDGSVYQAWNFYGTQGQMVTIDVMSSAFDPFCILQGPQGNEIARDDDSGDGLNARVTVALPVTGNYRIIANTYRQNQFGAYRVRLTGSTATPVAGPMMPAPTVSSVPLTTGAIGQVLRGQVVQGRLTAGDRQLQDNTYFQAWTYYGQAGEVITFEVSSNEFDAYALIQDANGNVLARDDDSAGGLNARIIFTLPATGNYRLIANTLRAGATGAYTLSVR